MAQKKSKHISRQIDSLENCN